MLEFTDMPLSYLFRIQLLLLFALLQCVAPLAHAHVNGDNTDHHVHVPASDAAWLNAVDNHADAVHLSVGELHYAVVCTPPEYRCSDLNIAQPAIATEQRLLVQCEHAVVQLNVAYIPAFPLPPYQHPCSQAPPA